MLVALHNKLSAEVESTNSFGMNLNSEV